jgi:hypothetical protein
MRDSRGKYHFTEPDLHEAEEGYAREVKLHRERLEAHAREANSLLQEANERQFQESLSLSRERARRDRALEEESRHRQLIKDITYLEKSSDSDKIVYLYQRFKNEINTEIVDSLVPEFTLQKTGSDGSLLEESIRLRINKVLCEYAQPVKDWSTKVEANLREENKMSEDIARLESDLEVDFKPYAGYYGMFLFLLFPFFLAIAASDNVHKIIRILVFLVWVILPAILVGLRYDRKVQRRKSELDERKRTYAKLQSFHLSEATYSNALIEGVESAKKSLRVDVRSVCLAGSEERVDEQFVWRNILSKTSRIEEQFPTMCRLRSSPELDSEIKNKLNLGQIRKEVQMNIEAKVDVFVDKLLADLVKI